MREIWREFWRTHKIKAHIFRGKFRSILREKIRASKKYFVPAEFTESLLSFDTEYDRAKVPPYNGNDPPPAPGSLKAPLFPPLVNEVQNKGTQGVRARYGAELPQSFPLSGTPVVQSYWAWSLHLSLSEFTGEWFTYRSNHIQQIHSNHANSGH